MNDRVNSSVLIAKYPSFWNINLDGYGLAANEYRVYGHIVSECSKYNECCEPVPAMAKACNLTIRKTQEAIRVLAKANLISQIEGSGRGVSHVLAPTKISEWLDSSVAKNERSLIKAKKAAAIAARDA